MGGLPDPEYSETPSLLMSSAQLVMTPSLSVADIVKSTTNGAIPDDGDADSEQVGG